MIVLNENLCWSECRIIYVELYIIPLLLFSFLVPSALQLTDVFVSRHLDLPADRRRHVGGPLIGKVGRRQVLANCEHFTAFVYATPEATFRRGLPYNLREVPCKKNNNNADHTVQWLKKTADREVRSLHPILSTHSIWAKKVSLTFPVMAKQRPIERPTLYPTVVILY